ncbi:trypco2 family protein [Kitasatospora sp. NPDC059408]|uniref:trypco2 family protein n=1 Tax=Kitasatospora sp. NPDC059408 TaxID=3346823 RepID=UPI0036816F83
MSDVQGAPGDWLDLADAVSLLRDQLAEALDRVAAEGDQGVLFGLGEVTLELSLELARSQGADAGLRFSVVGFGGKRERTETSSHRVTLRLQPHLPAGGAIDVSDTE